MIATGVLSSCTMSPGPGAQESSTGLGVGEQGAEGERQVPPFAGLVLDLLHNQPSTPRCGWLAVASVPQRTSSVILTVGQELGATINLRRGVPPQQWPP